LGWMRVRWDESPSHAYSAPQRPVDLNGRIRFLHALLKWRPLQFVSTLPVLACFILVILAGLFGTKVGGRNLAVMLTWATWMSMLTLVLIPLGGRVWCLVCPLPVLGEYLQRGATTQVRTKNGDFIRNRFFGLGRRWPQGLRGPWLRLLLFLGLGTFSASLAGQPRWTAITLTMMVLVPMIMSLVWELRSFCRFVCPVASFISCYSIPGRLMVRKRDAQVCRNCKDKPCLKGNAKGWACPYGLTVAGMERNVDCGICTECFKSCPYENVSLAWRRGPWMEHFPSYGEAWQVIVLLVLAAVYSLTVHSPWPFMRDLVNVIDKATWREFGLYAAALWSLALVIAPLLFWAASGIGVWLCKREGKNAPDDAPERFSVLSATTGHIFKKTMPALLPLGLALWAAFFIATLMINFTFVLLTLSDPFGWGWDLFGTAGMPWLQLWPSGIPWIQAGLILSGLAFSLQKGYDLWRRIPAQKEIAFRGFAPTAIVLITIAAGMLLYFTNY
jgi:polyferredoxin